jgi:hypothetical protein
MPANGIWGLIQQRDLVIIAGGIIHWLHPDMLLVMKLFKDSVCCLQEE